MKFLHLFIAAILSTATLSSAEMAEADRQDVNKFVPELVKLLEAKDYTSVLNAAVPPDTLKKLTEKQTVEEFAKEFGQKKAGELLTVLKSLKDAKPTLSEDGSKATFDIPEAVKFRKKTIVFQRIEKRWYLTN